MDWVKYLSGLTVSTKKLNQDEIGAVETSLGTKFPAPYKQFLSDVNGVEGMFGNKNYAILWPGESLQKYNSEYEVKAYLPDMILFGSDGGGEAFAFDLQNNMVIVRVPFVGMERGLATSVAPTFDTFIQLLCEKDLY